VGRPVQDERVQAGVEQKHLQRTPGSRVALFYGFYIN